MSYFKEINRRSNIARNVIRMFADNGLRSERLIKISQFVSQMSEDIGTIKEGVRNTGRRLSEIHRTVQTSQQRLKTQAAQHQSEICSIIAEYQDKTENQFSRLEKEEPSKSFSILYILIADSPHRKTQGGNPSMAYSRRP
jgi:hypothetical protein